MLELKGTIEHWNDQKGFGFILADNGKKFFFHISSVRGAWRPQVGGAVFFVPEQSAQERPSAAHVRHEALAVDNPKIRIKPRVDKSVLKPAFERRSVDTRKQQQFSERKVQWGVLAVLLVLPTIGSLSLVKTYSAPWVFVAYIFVSLLAYYFYWDDKRRAKVGEWRIPEANLHFWSFVGGWPGAFIAQQQFRHKTKKLSFLLVFWLIVLSHQVLWFDWLLMDGKWLVSALS
uniref:cold shock and DUF1294 domain-containing protein n=1 Tax=Cellvibrio fontiphilus TaxID=1815559 RepID=UPI002B4BABE5|nr:cold shock and DUF1294 domain-containing protein [Cellvibrio fontiphilus]